MELYTAIVREAAGSFTALCLENGLMASAGSETHALGKLQAALASYEQALESAEVSRGKPLAVGELHEFLDQDGDPFAQVWRLHVLRATPPKEE